MSAAIVDLTLYVVNNHQALAAAGASIVLYLPKIQTAGEAGFWNRLLSALEGHLGLAEGTIKAYVLIEQLEATFQLMEIRAALGLHFVGFNTGRWDYINSVSDANCWDPGFINPNIESVLMTYGYMRHYEDRVRRAVNTPDARGTFALWQGGMEPNIPVGSEAGVASSMDKARAGAEREQREALGRFKTTQSAPAGLAVAQAEMAAILAAQGKPDAARPWLRQALPILREAVLPQEVTRTEAEALAKQLGLR